MRRARSPRSPPCEIGVDGWPVEPPGYDRAAEHQAWLRRREAENTARLLIQEKTAIRDKYFPALMDAFDLCIREQRPLPVRLGQQVRLILQRFYSKKAALRKRCEAETERRKMHVSRWHEVQGALDHGVKWDDVFDEVGEHLDEKPETVRASYRKLSKFLKQKGDGSQFYVALYTHPPTRVKKTLKKT